MALSGDVALRRARHDLAHRIQSQDHHREHPPHDRRAIRRVLIRTHRHLPAPRRRRQGFAHRDRVCTEDREP